MSDRLTRRLRVLAESKDSAGFTRVKAADIEEMLDRLEIAEAAAARFQSALTALWGKAEDLIPGETEVDIAYDAIADIVMDNGISFKKAA